MSDLNLGRKAATRQRWGRDSIRPYIRDLQDQNPRASEGKLIALLAQLMRDDDEALVAAAEYAVHNALSVQVKYKRANGEASPAPGPSSTPARGPWMSSIERERERAKVVAKMLLLNQEMPNGLKLRDCSGNYVAKLGGQYVKAGKKAGFKLMGRAFDEKSLREYIDAA